MTTPVPEGRTQERVCGCGQGKDALCALHPASRFRFRAHELGRTMADRYSYDYLPGAPITGSVCVHTHAFKERTPSLLQHYQDLAVERAAETANAEAERDSLRQMLMDEREEWIALLEPHHAGLPCEHCKGIEPTKVVSELRAERDRLRDALTKHHGDPLVALLAGRECPKCGAALEGQGGET